MRSFSTVCCCMLLPLAPAAAAQTPADTLQLPLGETIERLAAGSDTTQHYALYLPSGYAAGRPVLFVVDPRGWALLPPGLFRGAAERHGYIVMSSYDTLSDADSAFAVNERALTAMIIDAQVRFTADVARFYLAGFSGTAHYAWATATSPASSAWGEDYPPPPNTSSVPSNAAMPWHSGISSSRTMRGRPGCCAWPSKSVRKRRSGHS